MSRDFARGLRDMRRFFHRNASNVFYIPRPIAQTVNTWQEIDGDAKPEVCVRATVRFSPPLEEVTTFGNDREWQVSVHAIVSVLHCDLVPDKTASFRLPGTQDTWSILAIRPVQHSNEIFRYDCLLGRK